MLASVTATALQWSWHNMEPWLGKMFCWYSIQDKPMHAMSRLNISYIATLRKWKRITIQWEGYAFCLLLMRVSAIYHDSCQCTHWRYVWSSILLDFLWINIIYQCFDIGTPPVFFNLYGGMLVGNFLSNLLIYLTAWELSLLPVLNSSF